MLYIIAIAAILIYVLVSWLKIFVDMKKSGISGPFPLPIVGQGHYLLVDSVELIKVFQRFGEKFDGAVFCQILTRKYVTLSHPRFIEHIVSSTEIITKGRSYIFLHPWLGQGLLTASGHRWKTHRKFLTPAFHFNILQSFLPVFLKTSKVLVDQLKQHANGEPFDLFPIIALAALDNVTESIMGVSFNALKDSESKYVKSIETLSEIVSQRMRNLLLGNDFLFSLTSYKKEQEKALEILHGHTNKVIEMRRRQLASRNAKIQADDDIGLKNKYAFLDLLLLAEVDGKPISDECVREEVDTFMFEGHDTTASGIVYSLYCIAQYQDVQQKILDEIKTVLGDDLDREPTFTDLQQMKYIDCVIKEVLRVYPSVPFIQREATQDIRNTHKKYISIIQSADIENKIISKGTSVIVDIIHMQRNPDVFEDPMTFKPERFFETTKSGNAYNWIPFSAGPRNCIGQKFAMLEMKATIAAIVSRHRLLPSGKEPELCGALILKAKDGVTVRIKPRI